MFRLTTLLYGLVVTVVLAAIVHLVVVLAIPAFAEKDAWARLSTTGEPWSFSRVATPGEASNILDPVDPGFGAVACRFDLSEAPLEVRADGRLPFWSASIFDKRGRNVYSFNDRTAIGGTLFLIVVDPVQMAQLRKNPPEEAERAVLVEASISEGFVIVRGLQEDPSWRERVATFLDSAACGRYELPEDIAEDDAERTVEDLPEDAD